MTAIRSAGAAAVVAAVLALVSCSTTPPEIVQTFWQVNLVRDIQTGASHERLSFFVQVSNTDGLSDLGTIYLLNDKQELYWRLDPSNWDTSNKNGVLWVGSNFLQMPDEQAIPRGSYRVLVSNLAGERATGSIFVSANHLEAATTAFPTVSTAEGRVTVTGHGQNAALWLYNLEGQLVGSRPAVAAGYPLVSLVPGPGRGVPLTVYAYEYDNSCGCGLVSGPYELNRGR